MTNKEQAAQIAASIDRLLNTNKRIALMLRQGSGAVGPSDLPMLAELFELNTEILSNVVAIVLYGEEKEE